MDNVKPFLDVIGHAEGTTTIPASEDGYNVLVGSTLNHPILFHDYSTHPNVLNHALNSTAAGRYQITHPTFVGLCKKYGYTDFTPKTQDSMAVDLIDESGALDDVDNGNFAEAIQKCSKEWASLPGSTAGQRVVSMWELQQVYSAKGGELNA